MRIKIYMTRVNISVTIAAGLVRPCMLTWHAGRLGSWGHDICSPLIGDLLKGKGSARLGS